MKGSWREEVDPAPLITASRLYSWRSSMWGQEPDEPGGGKAFLRAALGK